MALKLSERWAYWPPEQEPDPFDPRFLVFDWESYIWSGNTEHKALVDYEDYLWFVQWQWRFKPSRGSLDKGYLFRTIKVRAGDAWQSMNQWLHIEVMKRTGEPPPSPEHTMVDHRNGDGLDCRRENLRWATPSQNAYNRGGRFSSGFHHIQDLIQKGRAR